MKKPGRSYRHDPIYNFFLNLKSYMLSNTQANANFGEAFHVRVILPGIEDLEVVVDFEIEIFIEKALKV